MVKISVLDRILLLLTGLLAAYQIAIGIDPLSTPPIIAYTIGFGVLLVACLLLIILGFDVLDSPFVVTISSIIPLSLSWGLTWEHLPAFRTAYLVFIILGFLAIVITRALPIKNTLPVIVLTVVHGVTGLIIFALPLVLVATGQVMPIFSLVGMGGALIGIGGLSLFLLKTGKPILSRQTVLKLLPGLLLVMTFAFVLGFSAI